jgi:leucyl/phenylalanyl-tRNA--protein transferase
MPVFYLTEKLAFPHPSLADPDGILATGGDLSTERLLLAYKMGIFPWFDEDSPIIWWSPDPRLILIPSEVRVSRSLRAVIKKGIFTITFDKAFEQVIKGCARVKRPNSQGTWITSDMITAYTGLHKEGYAHSVETWYEGVLVGGLYGVSLGKAFFGESMFSLMSNASKVALVALCQQLVKLQFSLIDCQVVTRHLISMGAKTVSRKEFLAMLSEALKDEGPTSFA